MAEAVFRSVAENNPSIGSIDSAGTGAYHELDPPDPRTMAILRKHQIVDYNHAARKVTRDDFREFDYVLAMDKYNLQDLLRVRDSVISGRGGKRHTADSGTAGNKVADVRLFGDFADPKGVHAKVGGGEQVQDPYYGAHDGFEEVYQQVVRFSKGFLGHVEGLDGEDE
jgi:low molecular weight phosphotyrosine protein phosphatase